MLPVPTSPRFLSRLLIMSHASSYASSLMVSFARSRWCTILVLGCSCPQIFPRFGCGGCACSCAPSNPSSDMFAAVLLFLALISLPSNLTTTETLGTGGQKLASCIALPVRPPTLRGHKLLRQSVANKQALPCWPTAPSFLLQVSGHVSLTVQTLLHRHESCRILDG